MEYSPKKMSDNLSSNGFNFKKKFGQNFIVDENIINSIIDKSHIDNDTLVIEIGPGAGSLTDNEIDEKLKPILEKNISKKNNLEIIFKNFLESNVKEDIKKYNYEKLYVIANLPYYITTPIIIKLIEDDLNVDKIVVMVQKEVGDRFKATPGSKDYSSLSVFLGYYYNIKKLMDVSRNVFIPKPNVDSIVVEFSKKNSLLYLKDTQTFYKLIRDSFKQKRKTLKNNLKDYNLIKIEETLKKYNFDLTVRAEQLPIEAFIDISNSL